MSEQLKRWQFAWKPCRRCESVELVAPGDLVNLRWSRRLATSNFEGGKEGDEDG